MLLLGVVWAAAVVSGSQEAWVFEFWGEGLRIFLLSLSRSLSVSSRAGIEVRALERAPKMALGLARRSLPDF